MSLLKVEESSHILEYSTFSFFFFFTNYIFFLNLLVLFFQIDLKGTNCFKWHCDGDIPVYSKYFYVN